MRKPPKSNVFNNSIGNPYDFTYPSLTNTQEKEILASLFEQLLIFDRVTISTNRLNFALLFLISRLGLKTIERLLDSGYIKLMIWSPVIVTSTGTQKEDGTLDQSTIFGQPPLAAGSLSDEDLDPERNISYALNKLGLNKRVRKDFTKKAVNNYIVPDGMDISTTSEKIILDAYLNNNLAELGLPYQKELNQLDINEREILLHLGHKVIETAILSKHGLKSYENYEHFEICKQNLTNIGRAYNIAQNSNEIFKIENVPNLKELFLFERLDFDSVFKIRHLSTAKHYRNWINDVGENANSQEITADYINQIKGNAKFFETTKGKLVKNLGMLAVSSGLGAAIGGTQGAFTGAVLKDILTPVADYGLGLLETFWLDSLLKGKNPSMFVEEIKKQIDNV